MEVFGSPNTRARIEMGLCMKKNRSRRNFGVYFLVVYTCVHVGVHVWASEGFSDPFLETLEIAQSYEKVYLQLASWIL